MSVLDTFRTWLEEAGKRHSANDQAIIQGIHDQSAQLGANCAPMTKSESSSNVTATSVAEVIRHEDGKWVLYSHDGSKKLGEFETKEEAEKRERQIQFFKHQEVRSRHQEMFSVLDALADLDEASNDGVKFVIGFKKEGGSEIQSVIFDKRKFTKEQAKAWLEKAKLDSGKVDETEDSYRFRQHDPGDYTRFRVMVPGQNAKESAGPLDEATLTGDVIPLVEKAVRADGTVPIKLIQPGWGSSAYYPPEVLERDGPKVFTKGLKMYWNHPTPTEEAERPERDLRDLAAELVSDARWLPAGPTGPGLYADAKVFGSYKEAVNELAPHIGVSIRALGKARLGEADGKKGKVLESFVGAKSVDFVTTPGAGGQILSLFEAARSRQADHTTEEVVDVTEQEAQTLRESLAQAQQESARLREALLLHETRGFAAAELAKIEMPDLTRVRLVESLASKPIVKKDGKLDEAAMRQRIREAAKEELDYLTKITGTGTIRGMGSAPAIAPLKESQERIENAFKRLGLSETGAKLAAVGRDE